MIRPLRRRHVVAWCVVAFVVPVVVVLGAAVRPGPVFTDLPGAERTGPPLPRELVVADRDDARFALRADGAGAFQVEILVKRPLSYAAVAVHAAHERDRAAAGPLLGVLGARGLFRFAVDRRPRGLVLRDPVRGESLGFVDLAGETR